MVPTKNVFPHNHLNHAPSSKPFLLNLIKGCPAFKGPLNIVWFRWPAASSDNVSKTYTFSLLIIKLGMQVCLCVSFSDFWSGTKNLEAPRQWWPGPTKQGLNITGISESLLQDGFNYLERCWSIQTVTCESPRLSYASVRCMTPFPTAAPVPQCTTGSLYLTLQKMFQKDSAHRDESITGRALAHVVRQWKLLHWCWCCLSGDETYVCPLPQGHICCGEWASSEFECKFSVWLNRRTHLFLWKEVLVFIKFSKGGSNPEKRLRNMNTQHV